MKKLFCVFLTVSLATTALLPSLWGCNSANKPAETTDVIVNVPTAAPTPKESDVPEVEPTDAVTDAPTDAITDAPTSVPTSAPTSVPTAAPTAAPTAVPKPTSNPNGHVSIGTPTKPARFTMPTDLYGIDAKTCEKWFSDAVFVGDSITLGWKNYNNLMLKEQGDFFGNTRFFCEGSYGVRNALVPISSESLHPVYGGSKRYIWDAVSLMKAKKVFLLFGLNDITLLGVDGTAEKFEELINKIVEVNPGVRIHIISAMYMYKGSEREKLNNKNIYLLNQKLAALCNRRSWEFVNIASHLIDENGFVPDEYSSDHYVHQTYKAYEVWADVLRSVAARHLNGITPVVFDTP